MGEEGKPRKTDRRVIKTQKAIRQAFRKLLAEQDVDKITVSALAREADIDRKTFYLHFPSIDALIEQEVGAIVDRIAKALSSPATASEGLTTESSAVSMKRVLIELANLAEENPGLYQRIISSTSLDQMVDALHEPVLRAASESQGEPSAEKTEGFDYLVRFYIAGTLSVFTQWFMNDHDRPIDSIVDIVGKATDGKLSLTMAHGTA